MKRVPVQTPAMAKQFLLGVLALAALAWPADVAAQSVKAPVLSSSFLMRPSPPVQASASQRVAGGRGHK